jgi:cellulose synthase/poly-beta-1,6-N-acetylglucosamine synthase-like glycosyltransferase
MEVFMPEGKPRVLLGSPIRQKTEILSNFLSSIKELSMSTVNLDFYFIDDNSEEESSQLLAAFAARNPNTSLTKVQDERPYICNESTHIWEEELIWKVAELKNSIINKAREDDYDYLFLVDSDLVLHPQTLEHLVSLKKDIVSEIFWTRWQPDFPELPQVWVSDQYNLFKCFRGENLSESQVLQRVLQFLNQVKVPGVYKVGGLGACTLISKRAIQAGVNFKEIYNISFVGEDRHFCIRAVALGFELFVDTHYPAFHIYRLSELGGLAEFKMRINQTI